MESVQKKLSEKVATLIRQGVNTYGSYEPWDVLEQIEEQLTSLEHNTVGYFLQWCVNNDRKFGHNIKEVYADFHKAEVISH